MATVNEKLLALFYASYPATLRRVRLDRRSMDMLMNDHDAYVTGAVSPGKNGIEWHGLPIIVEAAPPELAPPTFDEGVDVETMVVDHETQVTIEGRRRDNGRVFYLDDAGNSDVWKRQGAPE